MSRIGKLPIPVSKDVKVSLGEDTFSVKGPKGELSQWFDVKAIEVEVADDNITVKRLNEERDVRSKHGLYRSLFANMVSGVTEGYKKVLEINGVGFHAELKGKSLEMHVGFPEPRVVAVPDDISVTIEDKNTRIILTSCDKQSIGQVAAEIRRTRPPEPYKGKGVKYSDEVIRKKAGKTAT